ncbi:MAG: phosphotransferase, partial [Chloroflexota bacterium]|nr:phosphotransferase [Chloroflexota bacterium]
MREEEVPFADGNVTGAVRIGDTVRRGTGPWTPAVHALLRHLERAGFEGAPRVLGIDDQWREVLTYVPGETDPNPRVSFGGDEALAGVARLLRRYHDAVASFEPPLDAAWRPSADASPGDELICHNDIAPYNTIVSEGRPVAFIDWDLAAPGTRKWDLAHALWRFVPLYEDWGSPEAQGRRLRLFCDAYGLGERRGLLDIIERRQRATHDGLRAWAEAGEPAFQVLWREGHGDAALRDLEYVRR